MNAQAVITDRPRTRRECPRGPCPHVACHYHLWTERRLDSHGAVTDITETALFGNRAHTCTLHEAAHGAKSLEEIAGLFDLSRERVRQIEAEALARLRDGDPGVLRELLDAVSEQASEGEPWTDEPDDPGWSCDDASQDAPDDTEPVADESGAPEGADDPVGDDTGSLPWSEPTSTDPRVQAVNQQRIERATARAGDVQPYWCPHCGRTFPGVNIFGMTRRGCPNPRCAAQNWGDRAREQNRHREGIAPEIVAAIRSEYRPGEHGYRALAREHGLPLPTVASILRRSNREVG